MRPWLIAADRGGTFTDCCAIAPDGARRRAKLLSNGRLRSRVAAVSAAPGSGPVWLKPAADWDFADGFFTGWTLELFRPEDPRSPVLRAAVKDWSAAEGLKLPDRSAPAPEPGWTLELFTGESAPATGARLLTGTRLDQPFPPLEYRLATTLATNALLENQGAKVAFFVTKGFRDLLEIGDQRRPRLFARGHRKDPPFHHAAVEVIERLDAAGDVLVPLDEAALAAAAADLAARGFRSAAVALAHSYRNPAHELRAREILLAAGFTDVSLSAELAPLIRLLPRAQTAVVNAALSPVMDAFVESVRSALGGAARKFHLLTSAGGLAEPEAFHAKDSLFSGPAGGVAGCAAAARRAGISRILTLDMGGTSTDVARRDGDFIYQFEQRLGQSVILAPALRIETVAAGGGSICDVTAEGLTVGPRSAGSDPGPACYGRGGPLTLTDVNLLLGRLDPDKAGIPLDPVPAREALERLKFKMREHGLPEPESDEALLRGLLKIAIGRMAEAVRRISVRDGCDPADYTLVAFGGAGPQHACAIAEELGISDILVPAEAGLLSAAGALGAAPEAFAERQILEPLGDGSGLLPALRELEAEALRRLAEPGGVRRRIAELRLKGQETALAADFNDPAELPAAFHARHAALYGYAPPAGRPVEVVSLRVVASPPAPDPGVETFPEFEGEPAAAPVIEQDRFSTLVVEPGWLAVRGGAGSWRLRRTVSASAKPKTETEAEAAVAELFRSRFQGITDAMGEMLRRTAVSTNVKERLDFSCALLDAKGRLLVNAPHIPVHLGALGECVRRVTAALPPRPGDALVTNDPAFGGSHLPDVTVILPVYGPSGKLLAFTANRAHHAEIGGVTPGSMPAFAKNLAEEGVVLPPRHLARDGVSCEDEIAGALANAPFPTRALADNLADLRAQTAAARHGAEALLELCRTHGEDEVRKRLERLTDQARDAFVRTLERAELTEAAAEEFLDDGTPVRARLTKTQTPDGPRLRVDFTGSGGTHPGNRNATPAIARSAVLYTLRLWIGEDIPLNEGILERVDIVIPPGFLNPPFDADPSRSPAVVGGNVETSQRVVDTLVRALELEAGSQGTMNNVIFGNATFGHYETLCGGAGAGPDYDGASALHTHMTNTAVTDVEILERRYPVRIEEFSVRRRSGGDGARSGGDGATRVYRFLENLTLSLLTEHRTRGPAGLRGGGDGLPGRQTLTTPDGVERVLPGTVTLEVPAGSVLRVETPGGGGWGEVPRVRAGK